MQIFNIEMDILLSLLSGMVTTLLAICGWVWFRLYKRLDSLEDKVNNNDDKSATRYEIVKNDLHDIREELPKNYVTKDDFQRFETTITKLLSDMTNGISDIRGDIADLIRNKQDK
jgi:hypothetical protein